MQIKSTLKQLIKNNPLYKDFICPMRIKLQEKALAKLDDESYFIKRHKQIFGYIPDFKNPQTFNEKIIHRILFDRNPIYTALADKLKARIYIATTLQHFNPTHNTQDNTIYTTGGGGQPYSLNHNNIDLQNNPTLNTTTSTTPQTQNKDSILAKDSLLFQPIDTLTQELFNTNSCPYLPKLYGIYKSVNEIDFSKLPQSFVLKTNHDCGGVVLVKDKVAFLKDSKSFSESMDKLTQHLNTNFYTTYREWHYKDIEPRIFVEEMLLDGTKDPDTYKFHIFQGLKDHYIQLTADRFTNYKRTILDKDWQLAPFGFLYDNANNPVPPKPSELEHLKRLAFMLSQMFDYVRVDLYYMPFAKGQKIVVGELTFTHACGTERFVPESWDKKLGNMWQHTSYNRGSDEGK